MKKYFLWLLTISWAILIFYLTSIPDFKVAEDTLMSLLMSSGAHFGFFGVQAVLLYLSLPPKFLHLNAYFSATLATSLYGVIDELHQIGIPGRSADPVDWALDTLGALVFLWFMRKYLQRKS